METDTDRETETDTETYTEADAGVMAMIERCYCGDCRSCGYADTVYCMHCDEPMRSEDGTFCLECERLGQEEYEEED